MKALLVLLAVTIAARADEAIPKAFDKARYAETLGKSPFVLATKVVEEKAPDVISPFANLYIRGVGKADGKDYVLLQRLGEERSIRLLGTEVGDDGLAVKTMKVGNSFRETKVVLQKGLEIGEVGFKEDTLNTPPAAPKAPPGSPMQLPKPGSATVMPQFPGSRSPVSQPSATTIPRPQVPIPTPVAVPQKPGSPRQRVRVINN
jgi:hypothetical protein